MKNWKKKLDNVWLCERKNRKKYNFTIEKVYF